MNIRIRTKSMFQFVSQAHFISVKAPSITCLHGELLECMYFGLYVHWFFEQLLNLRRGAL